MTVTVERPRSVASLQAKRDWIENELVTKKAKIVQLAREQDAARKDEILRGEKRTGATSKVHQIGRKIKELDGHVASLEQDLKMVGDLINTQSFVETQARIADAMAKSEEMKKTERELWAAVIAAFSAFGDAWLALFDHYRLYFELRGSHRSLGNQIPPEARGRWDIAWTPAVRPPINVLAAFSLIYDVCCRWPRGQFASPPHATGELGNLAGDLSHLATPLEVPGDMDKHTGGSF
jgi:hypothetical protein